VTDGAVDPIGDFHADQIARAQTVEQVAERR
jgi:hypothetical protein